MSPTASLDTASAAGSHGVRHEDARARRRRGRRDDGIFPGQDRARGDAPRGEGGRRARGDRRQRRHHRARAFVRLGLAAGAAHALAVAAGRRDGHPGALECRSAALRVGPPLPARVHHHARPPQHAHQAPPLPVQPAGAQRGGARRGDRVPGHSPGRDLSPPRPGRARGGDQEDGAAGRARAEAGDPRRRWARTPGPRLRAGADQDRRRHPRSR